MIKGIQIFGIVVGLFLLLKTYINYKEGYYNVIKTATWSTLSLTMIIFFYDTSYASYLLPIFTTQDAILTVIVSGILILFILINNLQNKILKIDRNLTELIQKISIDNYMKEKNNEK